MDSHRQKNGMTMTGDNSLPSKSEILNSVNTANWEPDVRLLLSTSQWLKVHGLRRRKLDMAQILPSIGFRHSDDYVKPLKKPVRARYCQGLFTQVPYRDGSVFNLVASKEKLISIENQLKHAISLYKKRLEWLTTESRRVFGVIEERCVCIVLDVDVTTDSQFDIYRHALTQLLKEQVMFIAKINLIRCALNMECWEDRAINVTLDSMEGVLHWLWSLKRLSPRSSTCTVEAIQKAITDIHVEAVYLFTEGSSSDGAQEMMRRKIQGTQVPIHIVSFNCNKPSTIKFLKEVCSLAGGRFHAFSVSDEYEDAFDSFTRTVDEGSSFSKPVGRGRDVNMPSLKLGVGVREDVMTLWEELDEARNTLAEIQALQCEITDSKSTPISTNPQQDTRLPAEENEASARKSELYMSSRDWLKRHGLKAKKLGFYNLLGTLAFKHCDGVVDIQRPPDGMDGSDAIVRPKLVNAKYCDKFAHVRWKDGTLMHVHVSGPVHRNYEQRMLSALDSYRKRMEWLQKGSRELFGTIIEDQVCILIDTSSSMASRLFLVKDKLYRLMQEQLRHKIKFNLIKFDSRTQAWRDRLVDCNTHNLDNAWHWVKGLSTGGSTNTLAALKLALSDPQCHAIYLLTDGRPDQPPSSILAQIHLHSPVPVHTISFNCADNEANEFLYKLAQETGGRFHYFSEDGYDISGPRPYESQDLCLLREEIEHGLADLKKVTLVRNECAQLDWYGSNIGRSCSRDHSHSSTGSLRPSSANPTPPRTSRPASARARPATVRVRPSSARILHSSYKDYIVSSACKNVPQRSGTIAEKRKVPFGETRASILRLNLRKKTSSNWILPETREYLTRKQEDFRKPRRKGPKTRRIPTKEPEQSDEDLPIRKWLKKHGLVARKLTILDALAPTIIPHSTKYVPILDKHILSKVFDQVLPLAHTSGSDRDEVQLVNPQGVNLKSYEARLEIALEGYKRKLDELVFSALSDGERLSYDGDKIPSFEANRESMMSDLEKHDWPVGKEDIELLDKEIQQAEVFLQQSKDLRKASEQAAKEIAENQRKARQEAERKRMEEVMSKPTTLATPPSSAQHPGNKNRLRNHKVLARNEVDGFFYPGIVSRGLNSRYVEVDFNDFDRQVVPVRYVIPVEGARPCPSLKVGDHVLVKSLVPREDEDDLLTDSLCCYVPGIVQVLPLKRSQTSKCYTILRFNGKKITSLRNDLVKISKARYTFACRYIRDSLLSAYRSTSPFGIQPSAKHQPARITITPEGHRSSSRGSSTSSKHRRSRSRSRSHSHSRSQSLSPSGDHSRSRSPSGSRSGSKGNSGSNSGSRSSSRSRNSSLSPSPTLDKLDGKKGIDSSSNSEDEYDEKDNKTDYSDKVKGQMDVLTDQEKRLEALREHLLAEQEKQRKQNEELENKRNELQEQQQRFIQTQLDDQREKQEKFQEEQKQLQRQQEELLKRQREQQEQLLMQQHTQTQSLNLQQQQLVQQLANMVQQQTESATPQAHRTPLLSPVSSAPSSPRRSTRTSPGISPRHSAATSPRSSVKSAPSSSAEGTPCNSRLSSQASSRPSSAKQSSSKSNSRRPSLQSSAHADEEHESDSSLSSLSASSSSSSSSSASSKGNNNDSTAEDEKHKGPPEIQFHMNGDDEACLLTKGTHGLLISRKPLDQDPAVDTRQLPRPVKVGDEVLARWSDEGWYYRGTIQQDCQDGSYFVEDSVGDLEQIHRSDIITDEDDANNVIKVGDPVVGLHPSFSFSYAPGVVISEEGESMYGIRYYDGIEGLIPRDELYKLTDEKFESACNYILTCEESLVGQAVVARNDQDGLFHLGSVRERVGNGRQYIIEWPDQTVQLQSSGYMFGAHTKRHPLAIGDRVLALSDPAAFVHMPGWITGSNGRRLVVKFCNGKSSSHVDPLNCYWLSRDYYDRVVEDYKKKAN